MKLTLQVTTTAPSNHLFPASIIDNILYNLALTATAYAAIRAPRLVTDNTSERPYANMCEPEVWLDKACNEIEL